MPGSLKDMVAIANCGDATVGASGRRMTVLSIEQVFVLPT